MCLSRFLFLQAGARGILHTHYLQFLDHGGACQIGGVSALSDRVISVHLVVHNVFHLMREKTRRRWIPGVEAKPKLHRTWIQRRFSKCSSTLR